MKQTKSPDVLLAFFVLFAIALRPPACAADAYPRQPGVDALHYSFRVSLRDETNEIEGEATIEVRFVQDGVKELSFDLASASAATPDGPPSGNQDGSAKDQGARNIRGMVVSDVKSAGTELKFEHTRDRLTITLLAPPKAGDRRTFTIAYSGTPRAGLRIGKNRHGERTYFSENWPDKARQWLPMVDHPYDKATSEFLITAPARYQVVANGLLQEERDLGDGRRLTHWKQSVPIASWLNAVGVAQFASHHAGTVKGVPLESWVYHQDRDRVFPTLESPARRVLEFYSERIGSYPYEKLAGVQAAGVSGGTEHASAIFYGEGNVLAREVDGLVAHEIAHQWFGNSVTERDWDDVWLSEGFATYFTLLFTEHDRGRDAFVSGLKRSRDQVFAIEQRNPDLAVIHANVSDMRKVLNGLVYQKGGWVLHMLRGQLGSEAFWAGIRNYYERYRDANASSEDFRRVMEERSGQPLDWFFQQWLRRAGSPALEGSWLYRPEQKQIVIELAQSQAGNPFRLPLEIGITLEGARTPRIEKVELAGRIGRFDLPAATAPESVTLDPNCWVLMKANFVPRSVAK
jgi:aminopeptidase N